MSTWEAWCQGRACHAGRQCHNCHVETRIGDRRREVRVGENAKKPKLLGSLRGRCRAMDPDPDEEAANSSGNWPSLVPELTAPKMRKREQLHGCSHASCTPRRHEHAPQYLLVSIARYPSTHPSYPDRHSGPEPHGWRRRRVKTLYSDTNCGSRSYLFVSMSDPRRPRVPTAAVNRGLVMQGGSELQKSIEPETEQIISGDANDLLVFALSQ
ncbi:hypothetical protein BDW62DRAFT_14064 [Aspergillus aurantiobrunneus]